MTTDQLRLKAYYEFRLSCSGWGEGRLPRPVLEAKVSLENELHRIEGVEFDTLTHAEVLAPYVERKGVTASVSHGALLFTAGVRELDVSRDCDGWSCVRFDGRPRAPGEAVRIRTRADLDAHVAWVAGEAG